MVLEVGILAKALSTKSWTIPTGSHKETDQEFEAIDFHFTEDRCTIDLVSVGLALIMAGVVALLIWAVLGWL